MPAGVLSQSPFSLAFSGTRHSGVGIKGSGYFGNLKRPDGDFSSELSSEFEMNGKNIEHPLLVPTLTRTEIDHLLSGNDPTEAIYKKAQDFALERIKSGMSPFAGAFETKYPMPDTITGVLGENP